MTCRRPTISVRTEVLERLAQANSDSDAPDSLEFAPTSWSTLDRDSFTEGVSELLAYQDERVREEERSLAEELRERALQRAKQRAQARRWENEMVERNRQEMLDRRIEEARERIAEQIREEIRTRRARLSSELEARAQTNASEQEAVKAKVAHIKRRYARTSQAFLAAAALVGVVWVSVFGQARSSADEEMVQIWQDSRVQELSAENRVAELEAEIARRVNLSESERAWLETELGEARASLDASKKEREEVDRRRPVERPSKMARTLSPVTENQQAKAESVKASSVPSSVRVATDEVKGDGCLPYDPLCFDL